MSAWIRIGKVGKSHGVQGEFFLSGRDEPFNETLTTAFIGKDEKTAAKYGVAHISQKSERTIIKLKDVDSRDDANRLLHLSIWALRDELNLSEDEFYWDDMKNKPVVLPNGQEVGKILTFNNFGASDVVEVINDKKQSLMLPFVDQYFKIKESVDGPSVILNVEYEIIEELWTGGKKSKSTGADNA